MLSCGDEYSSLSRTDSYLKAHVATLRFTSFLEIQKIQRIESGVLHEQADILYNGMRETYKTQGLTFTGGVRTLAVVVPWM